LAEQINLRQVSASQVDQKGILAMAVKNVKSTIVFERGNAIEAKRCKKVNSYAPFSSPEGQELRDVGIRCLGA